MCRAANTQGSVSSNDLYLDIKCKLIKIPREHRLNPDCSIIAIPSLDPPTCQYEGKVIRAALKQTLNITCDIDSNPMVSYRYRPQDGAYNNADFNLFPFLVPFAFPSAEKFKI